MAPSKRSNMNSTPEKQSSSSREAKFNLNSSSLSNSSFLSKEKQTKKVNIKNITKWSVSTTIEWLKSIDYGDCGAYFREHKINGRALLMLNEDDLKEVIKHNVGQRKNLFHLIRILQIRYNRYINNKSANTFFTTTSDDEDNCIYKDENEKLDERNGTATDDEDDEDNTNDDDDEAGEYENDKARESEKEERATLDTDSETAEEAEREQASSTHFSNGDHASSSTKYQTQSNADSSSASHRKRPTKRNDSSSSSSNQNGKKSGSKKRDEANIEYNSYDKLHTKELKRSPSDDDPHLFNTQSVPNFCENCLRKFDSNPYSNYAQMDAQRTPLRNYKGEKRKTLASVIYLFLTCLWTSFMLTVVHDRVPDMQKYPPLPDLILDNVPLIPWAFFATELIGLLLLITFIVILIFHKYR
jgi:hypothetical protein